MNLDYVPPGKVAKAFMKDSSFVRGLRGPVGSGKSVACCMEIMRRAVSQEPNASGVRKIPSTGRGREKRRKSRASLSQS